MSSMRIAIPSVQPGGLEAQVDGHFGHCGVYTLVDVVDAKVTAVQTLAPVPHAQGGCLAAVGHLAGHGVTALIAGGMGMRPLMGFQEAGIEVYKGQPGARVDAAVEALLRQECPPFSRQHTCAGGHHDHGHA